MEYVTRGVCGQEGCRETRYYLDNGLWFCRRGHQQEGRQIEEDAEDFGQHGRTNRVKKAAAEKIQKTYRGRQAYRLFIQAYQLILWKQCHALVHKKGFPSDIETVVRDLWALRLGALADKFDDSVEDDDTTQLFSSQAAEATEADPEQQFHTRKASDTPRLVETLALCYLGALLLRLPVSVGDIYRFAIKEEIPFIRAVKAVPREMRDRLPQEYLAHLDTLVLLNSERLHRIVNQMVIVYNRDFGVSFPPLNAPLMLFEYIRQLALPLEIYVAVNRLQRLVGFTYSFPLSLRRSLRHLALPEAQLLALIVVATKLLFPFDELKRYPTSSLEPAAQVIDWKLWAHTQKLFDSKASSGGRLPRGKEILVNESDVFKMTAQQLDDYLDWYENSWLDSRVSNPLADMFPTSRTGGEGAPAEVKIDEGEIDSKLRTVISQLRPMKVISRVDAATAGERDDDDDNIPRPGSSYQFYRTESSLPETARVFYETAAKLSGLSLHSLIRAVFQTELKLQKWQEDQRRAEYHGEHVAGTMKGDAMQGDASADEMEIEQASDME
ncbi:hypothetical protein VTN77DRAFT_4326 [Rasamsonia byssochlamydoides]|uniref:uncharacterized protein n=1 Tax=Rasamsonia byssochlamydoides TaxID=89139 RepID=UPI003742ED48